MNTQLIQLIDSEMRKLSIAREALVGSEQPQSAGEQEPITAAALLNGVDVKDFPLFPDTNDNNRRQAAEPVVQKRKPGGMSPEGRARVAAAQKARWAKLAKQKKGVRAA